jgi:23S rRNA (uracil1939-C5)-methyltransferase
VTEVVVRKGFATEELMVVLVSDSPEFPEAGELAETIVCRFPKVVTVVRQLNRPQPGRTASAARFRILSGRGFIRERLGGLTFAISPASFFQVNPRQAEILCRLALEYAGLTGRETVIDAYCGTGTFSLFLAERARRVIGIEAVAAAVKDARLNAALNGANNIEFVPGLAEQVLPDLAERGTKADVILLDPPRQGCDRRVLDAVADMAPPRLIYVSCDPGTLARDLGYLDARGFKVLEVQPVDMFPHTAHVEAVVLMYFNGKR